MVYDKSGGFRIYGDQSDNSKSKLAGNQQTIQDPDLQIAMLQKVHSQTKIFGLLVYKGEIKGIRFYDASKSNFIDVAPWQINLFNISGMQLIGVRQLELSKIDTGNYNRTVVIEFLTQHEIKNYYRPNRMTSNDLAKALSYILEYADDTEYENIMSKFRK